MQENKAIDKNTEVQTKPDIITYYNAHKSGVDTNDQMCVCHIQRAAEYAALASGNFYTLLNLGGINSHVIHLGNKLESMIKRSFIKALLHELRLQAKKPMSIWTSHLFESSSEESDDDYPKTTLAKTVTKEYASVTQNYYVQNAFQRDHPYLSRNSWKTHPSEFNEKT
ncbi:hypothetical protein WA026_012589 [Henosepilachna vigintioctopunctata]|uniref:Uncharacterized protein n=1 Tax=Henosepilachna vigintioctopunctata TaxID=420089 RepID=A0AAW1U6K6_9CUCU